METSLDMATPAPKTTVGLKRVKMKKKINLNTSKTKLKSVPATPLNFSFHNRSVQKQTLRANNKALAKNLAKVKLDLRQAQGQNTELLSQNQENQIELLRLRRTVGLRDSEIENEVQLRIQAYMKEFKLLLEDVTKNMMSASGGLSTIYDKCTTFCRRSTSSRAGSFCNDSALSILNSSAVNQRRTLTARRSSQPLIQHESLLKADEVGPHSMPTIGNLMASGHQHLDMSSIMEQSVLVEDTLEIATEIPKMSLGPVSEVDTHKSHSQHTSSSSDSAKPSQLPKRVPKQKQQQTENCTEQQTDNDNAKSNSDNIEIYTASVSDKAEKVTKAKSKKRYTGKELTNTNLETDLGHCVEVVPSKDTHKKGRDESKENKSDLKVVSLESDSDENSLYSGFGEIPDTLVSCSPIIASDETRNRRETFVLSRPASAGNNKHLASEEVQQTHKTSVMPKLKASSSETMGKTLKTSKSAPYLKTADTATKSKSKVDDKSNEPSVKKVEQKDVQASKNPLKPSKTLKRTPSASEIKNLKDDTIATKSKSKVDDKSNKTSVKNGEQNSVQASKNPFKPSKTLKRTPTASDIKNLKDDTIKTKRTATDAAYPEGEIENPFKPSRNLLRSPVAPVAKIDSRQFLSKFKCNSDSKDNQSDSFLGASFTDEPTTYFNSDMEFTAVIDTSQLNEALKTSNRSNPSVSNMEEIREIESPQAASEPNKISKQAARNNSKSANNDIESKQSRDSTGTEKEKAMVEMRIKKPGNFTFAASRKEADGSRKPVPEKVSNRARSKKKMVTPEKDRDPNSDADKDVFNFGDRTPTVPLNKILVEKASSVYDLSMNDSAAAPSMSLTSFREKNRPEEIIRETVEKDVDSIDNQQSSHIYHLPLKGSPEEKPKQRRGRSKSGTRSKPGTQSKSKSRKSSDENDEDYVPSKSRSRSKSQKAKNNSDDEDYMPQRSRSRGRSRSRKTAVESSYESETPIDRLSPSKSNAKETTNGTDANSKIIESKSESSTHKYSESPVVVRRSARSRSRRRPIILSDSTEGDMSAVFSESDKGEGNRKSEVESMEQPVSKENRKSRTRSMHSKAKADDNVSDPKLILQKEMAQCVSDKLKSTLRSESGSDHVEKSTIDKLELKPVERSPSETVKESHKEKTNTKSAEPSIIYHLPLKGSPAEPKVKRMTRSRSRTRHASASDKEESGPRDRRSRSRSRKNTTDEISEQQNANQKDLNEQKSQDNDKRKSVKNLKASIIEDSDSDFQSDQKLIERKSRRKTNSEKNRIESDDSLFNEIDSKHKETVTSDTAENEKSDRSTVKTLNSASSGFQFVTNSRGRSLKLNNKETQDVVTVNQEESHIQEFANPGENIAPDNFETVISSERTEVDEDTESGNQNEKLKRKCAGSRTESTENSSLKEKVSVKEKLSSKTPKLQMKDNKPKSVRKRTAKEKEMSEETVKSNGRTSGPSPVTEPETPQSRNSNKVDGVHVNQAVPTVNPTTEEEEPGKSSAKKERLPLKTPAEVSGVTSRTTSSKSTRNKTSKSTRKKKIEKPDDDMTPKAKPSVKSSKKSMKKSKENSEPNSRLANLKRRLTMMSNKMTSADHDQADVGLTDDRKRSIDEQAGDDFVFEGDEGQQSKRARRTKNTISYVSVPLNKKLRQGDNMFEVKKSSPITKAKAEQARIILGQRKTILNKSDTE